MNDLRAILIARIRAGGPMPLADYMAQCLMHPEFGYYSTSDPLGVAGDFITAPEISQMFGELLGLALAQSWLDQGAPAPFALTELGPGRGTLMADIRRATRIVPGFHDAARLHLVETSPALRKIQRATLEGARITWHDSIDTLPDMPLFAVANEFFDALPIRQFQRAGDGWAERRVGLRDGALTLGLEPARAVADLAHRLEDTREGDIVELCRPAQDIAAKLGARIEARGGTALIVDYGDWRSLGDTLQAVRAHAPVDPLAEPGRADLTAHVDFEALARATPSAHSRLTPQAMFLARLGIAERAEALAAQLSDAALDAHRAAFHRLTDASEMGTIFKVIAFYPKGAPPPPGLEP